MAHVLVVEDSELVSSALRALLEATGHRASIAGSVAEAIAIADADRPDVSLVDLSLPDGDGLDVVRHLHAIGARVIVALTGDDSAEVATECLAAGCEAVLLKPYPVRSLVAQIAEWTQRPVGE